MGALSDEDRGSGREVYYRAALLGASSQGRPQACSRHFASCPYSAKQMIDIFVDDQDAPAESHNVVETAPYRPLRHYVAAPSNYLTAPSA